MAKAQPRFFTATSTQQRLVHGAMQGMRRKKHIATPKQTEKQRTPKLQQPQTSSCCSRKTAGTT
jgi:hypothetical protein